MSEKLLKAREYETKQEQLIREEQRPLFHLTPKCGWTNDPNGFSVYHGEYHLFYQYYPYDTVWGSMHWGHAVSRDLMTWEYRPVAMAPDEEYDSFGCFSGSAVETDDGRQLLIYTGVCKKEDEDGVVREYQTQCVAVGDGTDYEKYAGNPVITMKDLPEGAGPYDFRDPKVWKEDGRYYMAVGNKTPDKDGQILKYVSDDGYKWTFDRILTRNEHRYGLMWECPDYFELDGKQILLTSPQDMLPEDLEFHNGNGTLCVIGTEDADGNFSGEKYHSVDYGIDFYAPQTVLAEDGRRIMIGWMQNWDTCGHKRDDMPWFGQMSFPREIHLRNDRLIQKPVREIENYYGSTVSREDVSLSGSTQLPGIKGRCMDMTVRVRPKGTEGSYDVFAIRFADNGKNFSTIEYDPARNIVKIDRKHSGSRRALVHQRRCRVSDLSGRITLRLILDRYSMELFINEGEHVMSMVVLTDVSADGISFEASGELLMDVEMHELVRG
ncbi:MAG: glycoside hydrolase family 32 protein [Lachnospiraceae bacterium]|nr:glycoside hydrolase family 32 protein [Lachnospiraceae bacterium]